MRSTVFLLLFFISVPLVFVEAQFPVRVPRVNRPIVSPKTQPVTQASSTATTDGTAPTRPAAETVDQKLVVNDAATDFTAATVTQNHKDIGWYLIPNIEMLGNVPRRSALRLSVKKGAKELYSHRCELAGGTGKKTQACYDRTKSIAETGPMDVEVYFIDGDSGAETLARKYKIDVRRAAKADDAAADFYIHRHADAAVAYLTRQANGVLFLHTFFSPMEDADDVFGYSPFLRCSVNGSPVDLGEAIVNFNHGPIFNAFLSGRTANRAVYRDYIRFDRTNAQLPLTLNGNFGKAFEVTKAPGKWECRIIGDKDRTVFRTIRFDVTSDGTIVPHPEQRSGNVNLATESFLIDIEIPPGGSTLDKRLLPMPNGGLFYGIPWATAEGKAMAARVPKKGDPYPVPRK
ncbi:MAG: hypothetical protein IPM21_05685 [Acidobacteria bacterium]|nr:hypothetical protein [Acidobacteriota bacterium]